jgi:hypothetical protein
MRSRLSDGNAELRSGRLHSLTLTAKLETGTGSLANLYLSSHFESRGRRSITADEGEWPLGMVATSDGNVAVAWSHFDIGTAVYPATSNPSYSTGWVRRYDPSGATVGPDFSFTAGPITDEEGQLFGMIVADGTGHIVVSGFLNQHYSDGIEPPSILKRFALDGSGELDLPLPGSPPRLGILAVSRLRRRRRQ